MLSAAKFEQSGRGVGWLHSQRGREGPLCALKEQYTLVIGKQSGEERALLALPAQTFFFLPAV